MWLSRRLELNEEDGSEYPGDDLLCPECNSVMDHLEVGDWCDSCDRVYRICSDCCDRYEGEARELPASSLVCIFLSLDQVVGSGMTLINNAALESKLRMEHGESREDFAIVVPEETVYAARGGFTGAALWVWQCPTCNKRHCSVAD